MTDLALILRKYGLTPNDLVELFAVDGNTVAGFATHGNLAVNWWRTLRALVPQIESWPVILGTDQDLDGLREQLSASEAVATADILADSEQVRLPDWFRQRHESEVNADVDYEGSLHGVWPNNAAPTGGFSLPFDSVTGAPHERIWLGLVPGSAGWTVPAVLRFGDWNECPSPAEHVAVLRYWNAHYGAKLVGMSADVIEAAVPQPPQDQSRALRLALEQFAYCPDIITQGTETVEALAATLLAGSTWYFWWD